MSTLLAAFFFISLSAFVFCTLLVAIDLFKQWRKRRNERRRIEEHTDEFWRQVG